MEVTYKRALNHNYLVLWEAKFQETYQVGMITHNKIPGLLPCHLSLVDEKAGLYYEITSRQSLRVLLERRRLKEAELRKLLTGLQKAAGNCEEYLLDSNRLVLNPEYIYLEPDSWEPAFCYDPFGQQDMREELLKLAEFLLEHLERQEQEAVALGYEFYRLAGEEHVPLARVLLGEETGEELLQEETEPEKVNQERANQETMFLNREKRSGLTLRSENPSYPNFSIETESFLIGKKKDMVDGWLKARGISRMHGRISKEGDAYYLTDLNSTNGTFLNGGRLEINEKARIRPGDSIGFGDVRYVVEA